MLLAALLLFTSNCTFHKFLNVWGTGMKSCTFWYLSSLQLFFSLSLSHSLPFGLRGRCGRRGTNALVKGRRKWSPLLQKMMAKLKTKTGRKIYCHAKLFCFHWCRTTGAIGEAWVWQQGNFGPPYQIDICLPGLHVAPLSLLDKFCISIKLI